MEVMIMVKVNAMGDQCPIPVIKTKKAIAALIGAETVEVLVDNETAVQNVTKLANSLGAKPSSEKIGEGEFKITIEVGEVAASKVGNPEDTGCIPDARGNMVVVVSSDRMGSGNDELGKVLIKGFIFAITQLEELPRKMIFFNGGVTLTVEGSDSRTDLRNLEAQGVEIVSCGTCLDYYGVKDKLAVGSVTNMYDIVETMAGADKVVRPN